MLSTVFTVANTSDGGAGSLRQAILDANTTANVSEPDVIAFDIPGPGPHTIRPLSALPAISDPVVIDGYTQRGASPNTNPVGMGLNTVLMIELDGSGTLGASGLTIAAGNSTVRGLAINRFPGTGIVIQTRGGNMVEGNFVGTDVTGTVALSNGGTGVLVFLSSSSNCIGTNGDGVGDEAERNLISGNGGIGIDIGGIGGTENRDNVVAGNLIGTDITGTVALGNGIPSGWAPGVRIFGGAQSNCIGTNGDGVADAAERNVISANRGFGVFINGAGTDQNVVAGNFIGTNVAGTAALGNGFEGVSIALGAQGNRIGTDGDGLADEAEGNVISANSKSGVHIIDPGTNENIVAGNFIGTDVSGTVALGNGFGAGIGWDAPGVFIHGGAASNRIGSNGDGTGDEAERNIISGNAGAGVNIFGVGTDHNLVAGNHIGVDLTGAISVGNGGHGVWINGGAKFSHVGTQADGVSDPAQRNTISANDACGVAIIDPGTDENVVAGNYIGTDASGTQPLGNASDGIRIANWEGDAGPQRNRIGTNGDGKADEAERNVISANGANGIWIVGAGAAHNAVAGNFIGTDVTGSVALGNGYSGVLIYTGSQRNRIGTDGDGVADDLERNLIAGNLHNGVVIADPGTDHNVVAGNFIGTDVTGRLPLGNGNVGVAILSWAAGGGPQSNRIGANGDGVADVAERNIISANTGIGVVIRDFGTDHNVVAGNYIGTDVTGTVALGNGFAPWDNDPGVWIAYGAQSNRIGTNGDGVADEAERNIISANAADGVAIDGGAHHNVVAGNYIGTDVTGTVALGNRSSGVRIAGGARCSRIGTDGDGEGDAAERNIISGNAWDGVTIEGPETNSNVLAGNFIGTDLSGTLALGNYSGVRICRGAQGNLVGTDGDGLADEAEGNLISGNSRPGVTIEDSGSSENVVAGNYIGTDVTGTVALGNGFGTTWKAPGLFIYAGAQQNRIGTNGDGVADQAERNIISGNPFHGVAIRGVGTDHNVLAGNFIGTDVTGTVALSNELDGVQIAGGQWNRIGTNGDGVEDEAERNLISANGSDGIRFWDAGTNHNVVAGNFIGSDVTGKAALGNGQNGVRIVNWAATAPGPQENLIGTNGDGKADEAERNVISGNTGVGVELMGPGTNDNVVAGNFIGTDVTGTVALGNGAVGVSMIWGAQFNRIGSDGDGVADDVEGNLISANAYDGVWIASVGTNHNVVAGNCIGTDLTGTVALANGTGGVKTAGVQIILGAQWNRIGTNGDGSGDEFEGNLISGNACYGVRISGVGTDLNVVSGNLIGTDAGGSHALGNGDDGVHIDLGAQSNRVGSDDDGVADAAERNIISANGLDGVRMHALGTSQNVVAGNYIGTDVTGTTALGNGERGVAIEDGAHSNWIGTNGDGLADAAEGNLISGNSGPGVVISDAGTNGNVVAGNFIGPDVTGTVAMGNGWFGVWILRAGHSNRIGTNGDALGDQAERNVISGNGWSGVAIQGLGTDHNVVAGNYIGTDVTGSTAVGNGAHGVQIHDGAQSNCIGTDGTGDPFNENKRNVISGNALYGVVMWGSADQNVVAGNFIGTDVTGTVHLGNGDCGVGLSASQRNRVGTNGDGVADEAERNLISGNGTDGVRICDAGANQNVVAGNFIGTDLTGRAALGNSWMGIRIVNWAATGPGPHANRIGTNGDGCADEAERNLISGNAQSGMVIAGCGTDQNVAAGNYIGIDVTGTAALGNGLHGVQIHDGAESNCIGTDGSDDPFNENERNVISGNANYGVVMWGGADQNVVAGNFIGVDVTGVVGLPNGDCGVGVSASQANRIGTNGDGVADEAERNLISGNSTDGVRICDPGANQNVVAGNFIGTDVTGTGALGNGWHGVQICSGAQSNQIGGVPAFGNTIAFNVQAGVVVFDDTSTANCIQANAIHSNGGLGIDLGDDGPTANDPGDADTGPNNLQNFPVISLAQPGATTRVVGSLNSTANTTLTLDFYVSNEPDPSGFGEGGRWLDSAVVTTDASGNAEFDLVLMAPTVSGKVLTATATDPDGNTSEFSNANVLTRVPIQIDVKPGSDSNRVNLASQGVVAVAILTTDVFDASLVDASTVLFAEAEAVHSAIEDVDGDGDLDLVLHFRTQETNLADVYAKLLAEDLDGDDVLDSNQQEFAASLTGKTTDDEYFEGFDELDLFLSGRKLRDLLDDLAAAGLI